jgi:hypothetical protein
MLLDASIKAKVGWIFGQKITHPGGGWVVTLLRMGMLNMCLLIIT